MQKSYQKSHSVSFSVYIVTRKEESHLSVCRHVTPRFALNSHKVQM